MPKSLRGQPTVSRADRYNALIASHIRRFGQPVSPFGKLLYIGLKGERLEVKGCASELRIESGITDKRLCHPADAKWASVATARTLVLQRRVASA